jgi:DUF4097 and DUF4098 domain-containing protein YvlB
MSILPRALFLIVLAVAVSTASPFGNGAADAAISSKKTAIRSVQVSTQQGSVRIVACGRSTKGICAKKATGVGGVARVSSRQGDLTVAVPTGLPVTISTGQGDVEIESIDNPLKVTTDQGSITATALRSKTITALTNQGEIELGFVADPQSIDLTTTQGGVRVSSASPGLETAIIVRASSGDVVFEPKSPSMSVDLRTGQGTIAVTLVGGPYRIDASTAQGTVTNLIPPSPAATRIATLVVGAQGDVIVKAA